MKRPFPFATAFKIHLAISFSVAIWTVLFLILLAPFDVSDLTTKYKFLLMPTYGFLFITSYLLVLPIQYWQYRRAGRWSVSSEILLIFLFFTLCFFLCFAYYHSPIMNGDLSRLQFLLQQYIPISIIVLPLLLFLRWGAGKLFSKEKKISKKVIVLTGQLKKDYLQVRPEQLIFIKAADNYVEINYLRDQGISKHLMRGTLKKIASTATHLIPTHRSYLINPDFFERWNSSTEISVYGIPIPVSKTFRPSLEKHFNSTTNS